MIKNKFSVLVGTNIFFGMSILAAKQGKDFWLLIGSSVILIIIIVSLLIYLFRSKETKEEISAEEVEKLKSNSFKEEISYDDLAENNKEYKNEGYKESNKLVEEFTVEEIYDEIQEDVPLENKSVVKTNVDIEPKQEVKIDEEKKEIDIDQLFNNLDNDEKRIVDEIKNLIK